MDTKRIFVLGNGFDLAHYLPTAYVHFMDAMMVVENNIEDKGLSFDDLYKKYLSDNASDRDRGFFQKTKELYKTDDLKLPTDVVKDLQGKLKNNGWFQHFKHHLTDVDTWIDFENEIESVLISFNSIFDIEFNGSIISDSIIGSYTNQNKEVDIRKVLNQYEKVFDWQLFREIGIRVHKFLNLLNHFQIIKKVYGYAEYEIESKRNQRDIYKNQISKRFSKLDYDSFVTYNDKKIDENTTKTAIKRSFDNVIENRYLKRLSNNYTSFNEQEIFKKILKDLDEFSELFTSYICLIINKLEPVKPFYAFGDLSEEIDAVYTFNYSSTFERFYPDSTQNQLNKMEVQYIHGSARQENIVLGISDLEEESLKNYKIYGFVKTFQKLINNTNYMFLDNSEVKLIKKQPPEHQFENDYEILIWGHSLDVSDAEYIKEMFSLNNESLLNRVTIKVWYHGSPHTQLANLMHIMGKDIIQEWMKKGWLSFKMQAPDVYELNKDS